MIKKKLGEISGTVKEVMVSGPPRSVGLAPGPSARRLWEERGAGSSRQSRRPGLGRAGLGPGDEWPRAARREERAWSAASGVRLQGAPGKEGEVRLAPVPCSLPPG